jgi:PAS domain S-box-containing protein
MSTEPTANILIVDDDPKTLVGMEALLAGPGRKIVTVSSAQDALRQLLRHEEFSLILLDVRMPDMDGFETAELIRQSERLRHIPIIFLSAIDTLEGDVYRGATKGAVDYLFKPVVPEVLKAKVSVFVDLFHINERFKLKAIQQSEERFRLLVESMEDYAIYMLDPEGRVTSWNTGAERIEGYQQQEIIGKPFDRFYTPEDQKQGLPARALSYAAGSGRSEHEGWRVRKDGARFWANTIVSALLDERQNLVGFSVVTRDLSDRREAEEALRESERKLRRQAEELEQQLIASGRLVSLGEITASMAHEFNNPLGIVMGFAQDLMSELDAANPHHRYLQIINEETKRCQKIIQELLQFSRPSAAELRPTEIKNVIEKTVHLVENRLYQQKIELSLEIARELPLVQADAQQVEQVLINIYLNGVDAMPHGGKLTVGAKLSPHNNGDQPLVILSVADTGFGIEEENQEKIFLPFFTAKKTKGLGLGLPICERIIKNHGGRIDFSSVPGQGTTFRIYLPLSRPANLGDGLTNVEADRSEALAESEETS